jgi:hypothetical protein
MSKKKLLTITLPKARARNLVAAATPQQKAGPMRPKAAKPPKYPKRWEDEC